MTEFNKGDRVVINAHLFDGAVWSGKEECRPGDTATVIGQGTVGKIRIRLDTPRRDDVPTTVVDPAGLRPLLAPVLNFNAGAEPQTGEAVLTRARTWMQENSQSGSLHNVDAVLNVAMFLAMIDHQNVLDKG